MRTGRLLSWAVPLACGAVLLCLNIHEPWTGSYDANGALFSTVARNTLRYGLFATGGAQIVTGGHVPPEARRIYAHHPPGLPLAVAGSFALFGEAEWSARLVPILCMLGSAALVYVLALRLSGPWSGLFAAFVFVAQPVVAFYGRMPDHEAPGMLFALAVTACYLRWRETGRRKWLHGMAAAAFVGVWFAWVVAVVPWLCLGLGLVCRGKRARGLLWPAVASLLGFAAVLAHLAAVSGGLEDLWTALVYRVGTTASERGGGGTFGWTEFVQRHAGYFRVVFTVAALGPALAWAVGVGRWRGARVVGVLFGLALANVVGLRQGSYVHIYYQFYLAAPLALAAGLAMGWAAQRPHRGWLVGAVLLAAVVGGEGWMKLGRVRAVSFVQDERQMALAEAIGERTAPSERVLVVWDARSSFRQLTYYADRHITVVPDERAARRLREAGQYDLLVVMSGRRGRTAAFERLSPAEPSAPGPAPAR
jgi:4-amino-4-deoxy-L-arabinose transferase-like glycosyltransferase